MWFRGQSQNRPNMDGKNHFSVGWKEMQLFDICSLPADFKSMKWLLMHVLSYVNPCAVLKNICPWQKLFQHHFTTQGVKCTKILSFVRTTHHPQTWVNYEYQNSKTLGCLFAFLSHSRVIQNLFPCVLLWDSEFRKDVMHWKINVA